MKKALASLFAAALLAGVCLAQSTTETQAGASASQSVSASNGQASASSQLTAGSTIQATLAKPVDARKNKPGDEVVAKTTENVKANGQVVVPKGCKIIGHVTEVRARSKSESDSRVGIAFDRALLKDGRTVPLSASIQAIARAEQSASAAMADESPMASESASGMASGRASASGGAMGGATRTVSTAAGTVAGTAGSLGSAAGGTLNGAASAAPAGRISSNTRGVVGMRGLSLNASASNSTQGSVISSKSENVHLDSGTQLILRVN